MQTSTNISKTDRPNSTDDGPTYNLEGMSKANFLMIVTPSANDCALKNTQATTTA